MSVADLSVGSEFLGYQVEPFLGRVDGDLSDGHRRSQAAIANVQFVGRLGQIWLDEIRQVVGGAYLGQCLMGRGCGGVFRPIRIANVDETLSRYFHAHGPLPNVTYPPCECAIQPPWARLG